MAITTYAEMLPAMRPTLPDCEDDFILQMLQIMGREFHLETEAYEVKDTQNLVADQKLYTVTLPADYELVRVRRVETFTDEMITQGISDGVIRLPISYDVLLPDQLEFFPHALSTDAVVNGALFRLILAPEEDTDTIDIDFLNRWNTVIKAGALMELYGMENRVWAAPQMRSRESRKWINGISKARREVYNMHTSRQLGMRAPDFIGRSSQMSSSRRDQLLGGFHRS